MKRPDKPLSVEDRVDHIKSAYYAECHKQKIIYVELPEAFWSIISVEIRKSNIDVHNAAINEALWAMKGLKK